MEQCLLEKPILLQFFNKFLVIPACKIATLMKQERHRFVMLHHESNQKIDIKKRRGFAFLILRIREASVSILQLVASCPE